MNTLVKAAYIFCLWNEQEFWTSSLTFSLMLCYFCYLTLGII
jgi:hypothetical protein